jgi:hypothetical protein
MSCPGGFLPGMTALAVQKMPLSGIEGSLQCLAPSGADRALDAQLRREDMSGDNAVASMQMSGDRQLGSSRSALADREFLEELEVPKSLINLGDEDRILSWLIQKDEEAEDDTPAQ